MAVVRSYGIDRRLTAFPVTTIICNNAGDALGNAIKWQMDG